MIAPMLAPAGAPPATPTLGRVLVTDLTTPALLVDVDVLDANLATMAAALPGSRLRPHVKAHKCTALAGAGRRPPATRASPAPRSARSRAWPPPGSDDDLLLANEVVDARRLGAARRRRRTGSTLAVDSAADRRRGGRRRACARS